jgi:hypothetical protein
LAGTTTIGIDDPRRTLGGPIHTARLTVKTPPAAEVETPAAAERVRTGLSHSIWIFSTTSYNLFKHTHLYLFIRLRFSNLFIRHNNLFIRLRSSNLFIRHNNLFIRLRSSNLFIRRNNLFIRPSYKTFRHLEDPSRP